MKRGPSADSQEAAGKQSAGLTVTEFRVKAIEYHTYGKWLVSELVTLENFSDAIAPVGEA